MSFVSATASIRSVAIAGRSRSAVNDVRVNNNNRNNASLPRADD
ncbi:MULTISPECIES: hypothetical protein [unclassified Lysobacter]|nr:MULTISPECIES: hypothetical protein [unclassified Lysobacter]